MTQLILDVGEYNLELPESKKGGYAVEETELSVSLQMISGRMVKEVRGNVWTITYQYGYFNDTDMKNLISACEKGRKTPITCGFLEQGSVDTLTYSKFFVVSYNRPKFMWSRLVQGDDNVLNPAPMWGDFSVELREEKPHD